MNKTMGTLKVDFAGTREEASEFVRQHPELPLHVGNKPNVGNEGLPQLTVRYTSGKQMLERRAALSKLGWDGCIETVPPTKLPRAQPPQPNHKDGCIQLD